MTGRRKHDTQHKGHHVRIPDDVWDRLQAVCDERAVGTSLAVTRAITYWLDNLLPIETVPAPPVGSTRFNSETGKHEVWLASGWTTSASVADHHCLVDHCCTACGRHVTPHKGCILR